MRLPRALRDATVIALGAIAACSAGDEADPAPRASAAPGVSSATCVAKYPAGPYGTKKGDTLGETTFAVLDDSGKNASFKTSDAFSACDPAAKILVIRVVTGFCGTCRWQALHLGDMVGSELRPRLRLLDLIVRDDDGDLPTPADLVTWQKRQDRPSFVALEGAGTFVIPRVSLPRVMVVDPRTMKVQASLDDPPPETLANAVEAIAASLDGRPAAAPAPVALTDGRFNREQWDMLKQMRLFANAAPHDLTNKYGDDDSVADLGGRFFDDLTFSPSGIVSCEKCHEKGRTFQDNSSQPTGGVGNAFRNTPSIVLAAWSRSQLWDGRADSLWMQATGPMENPDEFGSSRLFIAHRVYDAYKTNYEILFGELPPLNDTARFPSNGKPGDPVWEAMPQADRDAVTDVFVHVAKAISAFERSFRATEIPLEIYLRGVSSAFDDHQKDGIKAFFQAGCAQCHWGNRMTDDAFHNVRFPSGIRDFSADRGRIDGYALHDASEFRSDGVWSDLKVDRSKPVNAGQLGGFKTPALRGVAVTAPYGHGGTVPLLTMAVDLHRTQGMPAGSTFTTGVADPWLVDFPADQVDPIVAFLGTLALGSVH